MGGVSYEASALCRRSPKDGLRALSRTFGSLRLRRLAEARGRQRTEWPQEQGGRPSRPPPLHVERQEWPRCVRPPVPSRRSVRPCLVRRPAEPRGRRQNGRPQEQGRRLPGRPPLDVDRWKRPRRRQQSVSVRLCPVRPAPRHRRARIEGRPAEPPSPASARVPTVWRGGGRRRPRLEVPTRRSLSEAAWERVYPRMRGRQTGLPLPAQGPSRARRHRRSRRSQPSEGGLPPRPWPPPARPRRRRRRPRAGRWPGATGGRRE